MLLKNYQNVSIFFMSFKLHPFQKMFETFDKFEQFLKELMPNKPKWNQMQETNVNPIETQHQPKII